MIITTTDTIDGYFIEKYLGTVVGADNFLSGGLIGEGFFSSRMSSNASAIYSMCIQQMISSAPQGTNAIIGIKSSITNVNGSIVCCLIGTAVIAEEIIGERPVTKSNIRREEERKRKEEEQKKRQIEMEEYLAERREKLASSIQKDGFDVDKYLDSISSYESAAEIAESAKYVNEKHPDIFDENILKELNKCVSLERMYGTKEGKTCVKKIKAYFGVS